VFAVVPESDPNVLQDGVVPLSPAQSLKLVPFGMFAPVTLKLQLSVSKNDGFELASLTVTPFVVSVKL
jgi:hypothetical protein